MIKFLPKNLFKKFPQLRYTLLKKYLPVPAFGVLSKFRQVLISGRHVWNMDQRDRFIPFRHSLHSRAKVGMHLFFRKISLLHTSTRDRRTSEYLMQTLHNNRLSGISLLWGSGFSLYKGPDFPYNEDPDFQLKEDPDLHYNEYPDFYFIEDLGFLMRIRISTSMWIRIFSLMRIRMKIPRPFTIRLLKKGLSTIIMH